MTICCCRAVLEAQRCYWDVTAPLRQLTFDGDAITANPLNRPISNLAILRDGTAPGPGFGTIGGPFGTTLTQVEFDMTFGNPQDRVVSIRIFNNGGNVLNDADGIDDPTVQFFDINNVALTAPFVAQANNGGGPDITVIPGGPLNGVARVHFSDIKGLSGANPNNLVREIDLLQWGISPAALLVCPDEVGPARLRWVDARTGATINASDVTICRGN